MTNDVLMSTRAIRKSAETPQEIEQLFDGIAYGKTAALLRMLEEYVGVEKFRQGVNLYLRRNAYGNASSSDFATAIDDVSGRDVAEILSSYVNQAGVPVVAVRSRCEGDETVVELEQSRFIVGGERTVAVRAQTWTIPVCFSGDDCVLLRERAQTFRRPGCAAPLFANGGGDGYYITSYSPEAYARLADAQERLAPSERLVLLRDDWFLVRAGHRSIAQHLDLAVGLGLDQYTASTVLTNLGYVEQYLADDTQRPRLQAAMRRLAEPLLRDLGWTPKPQESPEQRELRSKVITFLGENAGDRVTLQQARALARRVLRDPNAAAPEIATQVAALAAIGGDARLYDTYLRAYRSATDPRERSRYLALLSAFRDPALLRRTLAATVTDDIRPQDIASVLRGVLSNPAGTEIGWAYLEENWPALSKKIPAGHLTRVVGGVGLAACDAAWADRIRRFADTHPVADATRGIAQTLEQIRTCAAMREAQRASLAEWISRQ